MLKFLTAAAVTCLLVSTAASSAEKPKLNDAQIADIAYTAGVIDINAANQALDKSRNMDIRMFAQEMVADHTAVNDKATALLKKLGVTPEPNPVSKSLSDAAKEKLNDFGKLSGANFDRAYINNEVAFHMKVDDTLRSTLIPGAQNSELKDLLKSGLKIFEEHLMHAEETVASLRKNNVQASR